MDKRSLLFVACVSLTFFAVQAWFAPHHKQVASLQQEQPETQIKKLLVESDRSRPLAQQMRNPSSNSYSQTNEQFYVLETPYQQLVFSTRGGALAEINLPFRSPENKQSIVNETETDRMIARQSPKNAKFPLYSATSFDQNDQSITLNGSEGGYYPLLRRTLLKDDGSILHALDPQYYALAILSEDDSDTTQTNYRVTRFEPNLIQFEGNCSGRRIIKTFTIPQERKGPYCFDLSIQIDGNPSGLWLSSGIPEAELLSGSFSPTLRYQTINNKQIDVDTAEPSKKNPNLALQNIRPNWISNCNGYLGLIINPLQNLNSGYRASHIPGTEVPTRLSLIDAAYGLYPVDQYAGYSSSIPLGEAQQIRVFAGPYDESLLKELDDLYEDPTIGYNPEYINAQNIQGWFSFISQPFAKFLSLLMSLCYTITRSWGISIILLTILLRLMMYPLNNWSIRSQMKMQEIAPKIKAVQERYKKDPKKAQMEVMNLYREQGINPLSGCFPMLLQMPFLIGMFYLLKSSFPLRGASFIPGWIDNLAAPDVLFSWSYPIFFIGTEFHLLPIFLGLSMFFQQKLSSQAPKDPSQLTETQKQQKMMGNVMAIVLTVMFYSFPSGLNIYFISSNLLAMLQQWMLAKKTKNSGPKLQLKK